MDFKNTQTLSGKRVAQNTMFLYVRMLVLMFISIYTSRIVLKCLGVDDYGIYNVVGGFVSMFALINAAMTTATQRFLSYEMGKGNTERISTVFSTSVHIHIFLAIAILVALESFGLWFINNKMVFNEDRTVVVNVVFQLSALSLLIKVIGLPYNAALIAYERMSAFAYISIVEALLTLGAIFLIGIIPYDKLLLYATIIFINSLLIQFVYIGYAKRKLMSCASLQRPDRNIVKELLSFVGWNMIGSTAGIIQEQGINVLLNVFYGPAVNAASSLATQVRTALSRFVTNFNLAVNPQIVKSYAMNEFETMNKFVIYSSKFSFLLMLVMAVPILCCSDFILNLWLAEVPRYTGVFLNIVIITELVDSLKNAHVTAVLATGKVKIYQMTIGLSSLLTIPLAYIFLRVFDTPEIAMVVALTMAVICHFMRVIYLYYILKFPLKNYLLNVSFRMLLLALLSFWVGKRIKDFLFTSDTFICFIYTFCVILVVTTFFCLVVGMSRYERQYIFNLLKSKLHLFNGL